MKYLTMYDPGFPVYFAVETQTGAAIGGDANISLEGMDRMPAGRDVDHDF